MATSEIVLVDLDGTVTGTAGKLAAHQPPGRLHLAFSVFVYDERGRTLIQRRAPGKYHFPGVWANACCSHPRPGEGVVDGAIRRLGEELGISCPLEDVGSFVYRATCPTSGLVEHELDHVLVGVVDSGPSLRPDPSEVADWRFVEPELLRHAGEGAPPEPLAPWVLPGLLLAERARRSDPGSPPAGAASALEVTPPAAPPP